MSDGIRFFDRVLRAPKRHRDGTHRAVAPEATIARARKLMPRLGITRLANLTGLDDLGSRTSPTWITTRTQTNCYLIESGPIESKTTTPFLEHDATLAP